MSVFSISEFKAGVGKLARPNLFRASITYAGPERIGSIPNFSFRCEKAEFPGKSVATVDDAGGGGPTLKLPYDITYNDIILSVICSEDMAERKYFENWMNTIVIPSGRSGGLVQYHQNFARGSSMRVDQLNERGVSLISWTMRDIYPIAITPMNAIWEELNTYQRFEVTLTYRFYQIN